MKQYLKDIINPYSEASAKRFVTLFLVFHFIVTSFLVTFFVFYLIMFTPKGSVNITLVDLLRDILETDKWVMLAGLGFITSEGLVRIIVEKSKPRGIDYPTDSVVTGIPGPGGQVLNE